MENEQLLEQHEIGGGGGDKIKFPASDGGSMMKALGIVVFVACVVWLIADGVRKNTIVFDDKPLIQMNAKLDSVIHVRESKIDTLLARIDSRKRVDTVIVRSQTKVFNNYYHENTRINLLDDSSQFGLLSKNLTKGAERERDGYYDVPDAR